MKIRFALAAGSAFGAAALISLALHCGGGGGGYGSSSNGGGGYGPGGGSGGPPTVPANTVLVGIDATSTLTTAYYPNTLTVAHGTTVTWQWATGNTMMHNVTSGTPAGGADGTFASSTQSSGANFTYTFATAGTYHYYCTVHGSAMTGTITVN